MKHAAQTAIIYEKGVHYIVETVKVNESIQKKDDSGEIKEKE